MYAHVHPSRAWHVHCVCAQVPGQIVVWQDQPLAAVFFVNRGIVQLSRVGADADARPRAAIGEYDNFGIEDWLRGVSRGRQPRVKLTARALTYCDVRAPLGTQTRTAEPPPTIPCPHPLLPSLALTPSHHPLPSHPPTIPSYHPLHR